MHIGIDARAAAEVPAGRGRYVREVLRALALDDAPDEYVLAARTPWHAPELARPGISWLTVATRGPLWPLGAGRALSRRCEVVLATGSFLMTAAIGVPSATIVWDFVAFDRSLGPPRGALLERGTLPIAVRRCARMICISQSTETELVRRFPAAAGRTVVAPPAAGAQFTAAPADGDDAVLARHGISGPFVLATGTLEPRKNLPALVDAFASIPVAGRAGWSLVIVGAQGWDLQATSDAVRRAGDVVKVLGYLDDADLPALYRRAGLFCYPSLYEGFGIPVLEALQSGTAVLTSNVSSMPEVGGDAAFYADPRDRRDLREQLAALIADPARRAAGAAAGPSRAAQFSWARTASTIRDALHAAAAGR
jgi:glycosyltransferase involved in cell wall biosynthesis